MNPVAPSRETWDRAVCRCGHPRRQHDDLIGDGGRCLFLSCDCDRWFDPAPLTPAERLALAINWYFISRTGRPPMPPDALARVSATFEAEDENLDVVHAMWRLRGRTPPLVGFRGGTPFGLTRIGAVEARRIVAEGLP